jgi:hypothetical protein
MKFLYQFNNLGNLVDIHLNVDEASIKTNINKNTIVTAIRNQHLLLRAFYFSYDKNFKKPEFKKDNYEPLFDEWRVFGAGKKRGYMWNPSKTNNII